MTPTFHNPEPRRRRTKASMPLIAPEPTVTPPVAAPTTTLKTPRLGSHLATLVGLLQRPEGATVAAMVEATGWQRHSVRGALAGALKKSYGLTIISEPTAGGRVYRIAADEAVA